MIQGLLFTRAILVGCFFFFYFSDEKSVLQCLDSMSTLGSGRSHEVDKDKSKDSNRQNDVRHKLKKRRQEKKVFFYAIYSVIFYTSLCTHFI